MKAGQSSAPKLIVVYYRMDQPGPSYCNVVRQSIQENPENPSNSDTSEYFVNIIPRVGVEFLLGLEFSFHEEYIQLSSGDEHHVEIEPVEKTR